jgi:hypothetical protein
MSPYQPSLSVSLSLSLSLFFIFSLSLCVVFCQSFSLFLRARARSLSSCSLSLSLFLLSLSLSLSLLALSLYLSLSLSVRVSDALCLHIRMSLCSHELGRFIEGSRSSAPIMEASCSGRPRGDYYINFQDPSGQPSGDVQVGGKSYLKIGWAAFSEEDGYGWSGFAVENTAQALYGYDDVNGYSETEKSYCMFVCVCVCVCVCACGRCARVNMWVFGGGGVFLSRAASSCVVIVFVICLY